MYPTATRNPGPAKATILRQKLAVLGTPRLRCTSGRLGVRASRRHGLVSGFILGESSSLLRTNEDNPRALPLYSGFHESPDHRRRRTRTCPGMEAAAIAAHHPALLHPREWRDQRRS